MASRPSVLAVQQLHRRRVVRISTSTWCDSDSKNMPDLQFSMTSFGSQKANKKVLLLHGLMGTGPVFFKVADKLVKDGYRVDCPDLLGHGWAPHTPPYTISNLAKHLADNLAESYDVIGGVSFGSTIAAALYPLLTSKPDRLVLAEPLLDHPAFDEDKIAGAVATTKTIPTEEEILRGNPTWIAAEATLRRMSLTQIDPDAIWQLFEEVNKGHLSHSLLPSADESQGTEIIIVAADPDLRSVYPASNAKLLEAEYPHVKFVQRLGATHDMHKDKPDVLYSVLVGGLANAKVVGLDILRG